MVSWYAMIDGYYQFGGFDMALDLFQVMVIGSKLHLVTNTTILHVSHDISDLKLGGSVQDFMIQNWYECDIMALIVPIARYSKGGIFFMSRKVFDHMDYRDSVSWNSPVSDYVNREFFW